MGLRSDPYATRGSIRAARAPAPPWRRRPTCAPLPSARRPMAPSCARPATTLIVGLKPTIGLIGQSGIIPIAHSQDSAGPMARTVTDVAVHAECAQGRLRTGGRPAAAD